ncbi:GNAT family N-acetyltransferase [Mesorhizobium sp. CU2]|uniref:GNAT family N-acetyltransferase n=1 Tax=unclassified Mesorhizobium TaxID=325217 RepID=UPI001126DCC8|nr:MULTISPECIES: GNAT family N-acetyltransferase [unclassified Mesorhizobium]TPN83299.1 GNAT family N-acetyltransferase [Mesorhizobium sp. CU3]TPO01428.1 GNAT family N-acetyltransferase [Mesorhizobium sp. CU2]
MAASLPLSQRSARLLLRRPKQVDLDFVVDLFSRPELVAHRPDPTPDTSQQSAARLARDIDHWNRRGFGRWAVEAEGRLVGFGGITVSNDFDGLNLSYHLHPDNWGQGYASELVLEALRTAFLTLEAERVIALARPANPASRRVLEKCGFAFDREVMLHGAPTGLFIITAASYSGRRPA